MPPVPSHAILEHGEKPVQVLNITTLSAGLALVSSFVRGLDIPFVKLSRDVQHLFLQIFELLVVVLENLPTLAFWPCA